MVAHCASRASARQALWVDIRKKLHVRRMCMKDGRGACKINDQLHSSIPFGHANSYLHPTHSVYLANARKTQWATSRKPSSKVWLKS